MHYCPYLSGKYFKACSVGRETYVPSAFELGEYCASGRHTMCPFYSKREYGLPYDKRPALASGTR